MRTATRRALMGGAAIVAVVVVAGLWFLRGPGPMAFADGPKVALADYHGTDPTGVPAALAKASLVERGEYLARAADCMVCHTAPGGKPYAGGLAFKLPFGSLYSTNITPDKETGIGKWTDDQIVDAIRNGKRPDGTLIGPPMPIAFYRNMSDTDVRAIVAYLRSVKPIANKVEKSTYRIPLPPSYGPTVTHVATVPRGNKVAYGHYLATGLGHCLDCHTPLLPTGQSDVTRLGAGGNELPGPGGSIVVAANLTPGNETGIAHWTDAQVKTAIRAGMRPDRPLVRLMAFDWYKNISDADLDALVAYLRTLKPVKTE